MNKYCAFDKERKCDETCMAYEVFSVTRQMIHEPGGYTEYQVNVRG